MKTKYVFILIADGTTWLGSIVVELMGQQSLDDVELHVDVPSVEYVEPVSGIHMSDLIEAKSQGRPRFYKSHLPHHLLTAFDSIARSRCPILYITRNPKDMVVSASKFFTTAARQGGVTWGRESSVDNMTRHFVDGQIMYGPFHRHVLGYWEASRREGENPVMFIFYEELLKNPTEMVKRIAEFIGYPVDDERARQVAQRCSIDSLRQMPANRGKSKMFAVDVGAFFRRGECGKWREEMSDDASGAIDRYVLEHFADSGIEFDYN